MRLPLLILALTVCTSAHAHEDEQSPPPPAPPSVSSEDLGGGIHVLYGSGGNLALSTGADGSFLVDDQYAPATEAIRAAIAEAGGEDPRFVINTHWHGDHTGGNENFGSIGAIIIAHDQVRERMSSEQFIAALDRKVPPSPAGALPVVTFDSELALHLNGQQTRIIHQANAHTDGDALVHFEGADVLHMGDVFFNGLYPFIDLSSGGSINGMIAATEKGLSLCTDQTKVIPGHGKVTDKAGLAAYRDLLVSWRDAVKAHKDAGLTLAQTIAAKPTAATDEALGGAFIKPEQLVEFIYQSL
jgi:glyoxylase-like metal-dependent hydrolase (beta-lactamase superfamily II)